MQASLYCFQQHVVIQLKQIFQYKTRKNSTPSENLNHKLIKKTKKSSSNHNKLNLFFLLFIK